MHIAVTDACIFIDVFLLGIEDAFFGLPYQLHTAVDVLGELFPEQREALSPYMANGKLTVHNLTEEQSAEIIKAPFPKSLSPADRTVFFIAQNLKAMVLSSDKVLRNWAKKEKLEYHGILWIIETLVNTNIITKVQGLEKLDLLFRINPTMAGSKEVVKKTGELKAEWRP